MKCRRAKNLVYDFIDGVIGEKDRIVLEQHLGECEACEAMASSLSKSLDLLHSVPTEPLDDNFTWKVRLRLARARNSVESDPATQRSWLRSWNTRFAYSAAATFVAVIAAGYFVAGSLIVPTGNSIESPFVAPQTQIEAMKSPAYEPFVGPPSVARGGRRVGTTVSLGGDPGDTGSAGPGLIVEEDSSADLDSLRAEFVKSKSARYRLEQLQDQVDQLHTELRQCESECKEEDR